MPPKSDLKTFKTTMKRETSRIVNQLGLSDDETKILKNDVKTIIDNGKDEKTIINELRIHAEINKYPQYKSTDQLLKEQEHEMKKKQDILHPPLEDASTYKDVKKYTKEMVNARVKTAANKEGTAMERERKFREKNMLEKSRDLLPKNLSEQGKLLIDYVTKRQFIIDEENEVLNELKEYNEITPIEDLGILEEKDFLDKEYYETLHQYSEMKKYLKEQKRICGQIFELC